MTDRFIFKGNPNRKEFNESQTLFARHFYVFKTQWPFALILLCAILAPIALLEITTLSPVTLLGYLAGFYVAFGILMFRGYQTRRMMISKIWQQYELGGPIETTLSSAGIISTNEKTEGRYEWSAVTNILDGKSVMLLIVGHSFIILSKDQIPPGVSDGSVIGQVERWMKT